MFDQAEAYQRFMGRWSSLLAPELIRFAELRDGEYVLDVGSGTGAIASTLRDMFPHSRVEGIDPSEAFVHYATATVGDAGGRVRFQTGDAQNIGFPDATFDAALSSLVLNFVPDSARAIREMIRVTKPGGVFAADVWDLGAGGMEMLRVFWDEAGALDAAAKTRDEAAMPLCREGALAKMASAQGLVDIHATSISVPLGFASIDDFWSPFLAGVGPAGAYAASLPSEQQNLLRERLARRLLPGGSDGPFALHARAWAVKGTTPR